MNQTEIKEKYVDALIRAEKAANSQMWDACQGWSALASAYGQVLDARAFANVAKLFNGTVDATLFPTPKPSKPHVVVEEDLPNILVGISPETNAGAAVPPPPGGQVGGKAPCLPCEEKKRRRREQQKASQIR